jgi:hypothetical protein
MPSGNGAGQCPDSLLRPARQNQSLTVARSGVNVIPLNQTVFGIDPRTPTEYAKPAPAADVSELGFNLQF